MKFCVLFTLLLCPASAALLRNAGGSVHASSADTDAETTVDHLITDLIKGDSSVRVSHVVNTVSKQMEFSTAAKALKEKHALPLEVSALLSTNASKHLTSLDEASLTKARNFLNGLVEAAYHELDEKIIQAKTFEARNRGSWEQVVADIARLSMQIANHMKNIAEATACIASIDRQIEDVKEQRRREYEAYIEVYNVNYADMTIKQNDLDVFDFLIKTTKKMCDEQAGSQLLQVRHKKQAAVQLCENGQTSTLRFSDAALQIKFDRLLMKGSRDILRNALMGKDASARHLSFVQKGSPSFHQKESQPMTKATAKAPVISGQQDEFGDLKCGPIPDCGLLYDTLSLEWGGYKDQVDELKKSMDENSAAWQELKTNFDTQLIGLVASQDTCVAQLAEATGKKNADLQESAEKTEQKRVLDEEHKTEMNTFRTRIKYIFSQDICGPVVIRNEVMKESTDCAPKNIDDCDVTAWMPGPCSVECDDLCPITFDGSAEAASCGGVRLLTREAVVRPNSCGFKCPSLSESQKCNQHRCPVDCGMSRWSGWSKCSADCEGGVQGRTRSLITKPKNGGQGCPAVADGRPCHTGSCDRDCTLEDWTAWSPCSMACGRGNQDRARKVDIPIRGGGKCATPSSSHRLQRQDCNVQECIGDEICIANQDLIISVDGSGSVSSASWLLVKNFTGQVLKRYKAEYYGQPAMRIGVVLFGNGAIEEDGTISKAILAEELAADMAVVQTAAAGMEHQKGFTNMAQAFILAEKLLQQRGRKDAQSAVMTISDGKPSFLFETTEKARELEEKGIMKYMVAISEFPGSDEWRLMRELATKPSSTNTVRVPGFDALDDGGGPFVREAIAKFCPMAMSPSQTQIEERARGYRLVYNKGYCGNLGRTMGKNIGDPDECFRLAQTTKVSTDGDSEGFATGFSMGRRYRKGKCCVELLPFTCDEFKLWETNPESPQCSSSWGGGFHKSRYFDWYALEPNCES